MTDKKTVVRDSWIVCRNSNHNPRYTINELKIENSELGIIPIDFKVVAS